MKSRETKYCHLKFSALIGSEETFPYDTNVTQALKVQYATALFLRATAAAT